MILTVTPNPACDRVQTVPGFQLGRVNRSTTLTISAAGKGLNVARAVRCLGAEAMCTGLLGGHTGRMLAEFTTREGIPAKWTWIDGETRVATIALSPETGAVTVLNEDGPLITAADWDRFQTDILAAAVNAAAVCLSGSIPPGVPLSVMGSLITALNRNGRRVFADHAGALLKISVAARPEVVKINNFEAAGLLGWPEFTDPAAAVRAARQLLQAGITRAVITLGAKGAVLATSSGAWQATPPPLKVVNPIGSGDSFLAGLTLAVMENLPDPEALRRAVAAGSANTLSTAGGSFSQQDYQQVLAGVTIKPVS